MRERGTVAYIAVFFNSTTGGTKVVNFPILHIVALKSVSLTIYLGFNVRIF